ncbi:hypothetical protein CS542_05050 [Pedobacter sp. IW39]|nr:hypothetical protein CS542_05050 [Pedobacter sp. IW39]
MADYRNENVFMRVSTSKWTRMAISIISAKRSLWVQGKDLKILFAGFFFQLLSYFVGRKFSDFAQTDQS